MKILAEDSAGATRPKRDSKTRVNHVYKRTVLLLKTKTRIQSTNENFTRNKNNCMIRSSQWSPELDNWDRGFESLSTQGRVSSFFGCCSWVETSGSTDLLCEEVRRTSRRVYSFRS